MAITLVLGVKVGLLESTCLLFFFNLLLSPIGQSPNLTNSVIPVLGTDPWLTDIYQYPTMSVNEEISAHKSVFLVNTWSLTREHLLTPTYRGLSAEAVALVTCVINGVDRQPNMPPPLCFIITHSD